MVRSQETRGKIIDFTFLHVSKYMRSFQDWIGTKNATNQDINTHQENIMLHPSHYTKRNEIILQNW